MAFFRIFSETLEGLLALLIITVLFAGLFLGCLLYGFRPWDFLLLGYLMFRQYRVVLMITHDLPFDIKMWKLHRKIEA